MNQRMSQVSKSANPANDRCRRWQYARQEEKNRLLLAEENRQRLGPDCRKSASNPLHKEGFADLPIKGLVVGEDQTGTGLPAPAGAGSRPDDTIVGGEGGWRTFARTASVERLAMAVSGAETKRGRHECA